MNQYNEFLHNIGNSIETWLEAMAKDLEPGRFRYCSKGSLVPVNGQQAQVSTCFAMKIAWQTGLWKKWTEQQRQACIKFIQSFQKEDGHFVDSWLSKSAIKITVKDILRVMFRRIQWNDLKIRNEKNIRAETRQSASTLLMAGAKPIYPLPYEVSNVRDVEKYIKSFDWRNPWGTGSHLSHQLFMLTVNYQCFGKPDNYEELIDAFLNQLDQLYDPNSGTWFAGNPSDTIKINGAMKIFSGLQWLDRPYHDTRNLLDFALKQPFQKDGCGFLNRLFVIQQAVKGVPSDFRRKEIQNLAWEVLETVQNFQQDDGAFSFFQNRSQTGYYGASVTRGYQVSDLNGTVMLTWAIAIGLELLGEESPDDAKYWQAQKA